MSEFEPKIIGFLCNWCSYAASDSAGGRKSEIPACFKEIRVMCSGRIDPELVLKAFAEGADAVAILGCHPGDCHYKEGNYKTMRRFTALKKMLHQLGVEDERLILEWVSAAEGDKYVTVVRELCDRIRTMGPIQSTAAATGR